MTRVSGLSGSYSINKLVQTILLRGSITSKRPKLLVPCFGCVITPKVCKTTSGSMPAILGPGDAPELTVIYRQAAAIILKVAYGYSVVPHGDDPLVDLIARAMGNLGAALVPGVWLVDFIPFCMHCSSHNERKRLTG